MRRLSIQVVQAALAVLLAGCAIASFFTTLLIPLSPLEKHAVFLHFYEGRFRAFWIESTRDPLSITLMGDGPNFRIEPDYEWPPLPAHLVGVDIPRSQWFRTITIGGYRNVPSFGGGWRTPMTGRATWLTPPARSSFVRLPAWLLCVLLLYSPIRAVIRVVRERYRSRNNLCTTCGYLLHALTQPRCPECGTAIQQTSA